MSPAVEVYEGSSGGVAGGVASGGEDMEAEVGVEAETEEQVTPSESKICKNKKIAEKFFQTCYTKYVKGSAP